MNSNQSVQKILWKVKQKERPFRTRGTEWTWWPHQTVRSLSMEEEGLGWLKSQSPVKPGLDEESGFHRETSGLSGCLRSCRQQDTSKCLLTTVERKKCASMCTCMFTIKFIVVHTQNSQSIFFPVNSFSHLMLINCQDVLPLISLGQQWKK